MSNFYMGEDGRIHDRRLEHQTPRPQPQPRPQPRPRPAPTQPRTQTQPVQPQPPSGFRALCFAIFVALFSWFAAGFIYDVLVVHLLHEIAEPSGWRDNLLNWSYFHTRGVMRPVTVALSLLIGWAIGSTEHYNLKSWGEAALGSLGIAIVVGVLLAWVADFAAIAYYGGIGFCILGAICLLAAL